MPPVPKSKSNPAKIISVGKGLREKPGLVDQLAETRFIIREALSSPGILDEPLSDDLPASHSEAPSHTDSTDTSSSDVSQNNFTELVVPGPVHSPSVGQSNSTPQHPARLVVSGPVHSPGVGQSNSTPQHPARLVVPGPVYQSTPYQQEKQQTQPSTPKSIPRSPNQSQSLFSPLSHSSTFTRAPVRRSLEGASTNQLLRLLVERMDKLIDVVSGNAVNGPRTGTSITNQHSTTTYSDEAQLQLTSEAESQEQEQPPLPPPADSDIAVHPDLIDRALHIKRASCSPGNFAVKLLPEVFTAQELAPLVSNCTGTKGKKALDQHKLRTIKELVMNLYDIPIKNQEEVWKGCVRAIDEFLRRSNRSRVQKKD